MSNREEVYKREEVIHNDDSFDSKREENVNIFYKYPSFEKIFQYAFNLMGDLKNKKVLEYGCGNGENILKFVNKDADYTGFDLSSLRINRANQLLKELQITERTRVLVMNAEKIDFIDNSFDVIYAQAIIHHLDIETALKDIKRILKPNGFAVFVEPRGTNPLINYYRKKSPHLRTVDEHPLTVNDFKLFKKYFHVTYKDFYFVSLISLLIRKYLKSEFVFRIAKSILDKFDIVIFTLFPFTRRFAWYSVIKLYW